MFSEYASRFLAQSQSRISFVPTEERRPGQDRQQRQNPSAWRSSASHAGARRSGNPYQPSASQASGFPFASRTGRKNAPLFYSATDEFREENDEEEHEREIADYYALQKSRRHLGGSDLKESSETGEESNASLDANLEYANQQQSRTGGIRSSWRGGATTERGRGLSGSKLPKQREDEEDLMQSTRSTRSKMVDVGLEDTLHSEFDDDPPDDLMDDPPSVVQLRTQPQDPIEDSGHLPEDTDQDALLTYGRPPDSEIETSVPEMVGLPAVSPPRHDAFFGHLYLMALAAMFTTWFLVYLHTEAPGKKAPLGDTIYTTLHGSFNLLASYTIVSIFIALLWLAALREYVRYLVYSVLIAVPVILFSFSLYPFVSSYKGRWDGNSIQDKIMRWTSLVPAILATLWILAVIRGRLAMQKAISILEFATRVLAANAGLLVVGLSVLGSIIGFTWMWLSMFTRVFLGGHLVTTGKFGRFIIDASTWWLGLYFIIVYLWTVTQIFGIQRSVTSATVSQWYFHRLAVPAPTSQTIVRAALSHAATTLFGTISLSTALSLLVRLPLLLLPKRLTMLLGVAMYSLIPTPVAILINPLTLTYASIHSQPLAISARGLMQMQFLAPSDATTSLHPSTFRQRKSNNDGWSSDAAPLLPYRLAKLLLHATRFIMSFALGYGGWVSTARSLKLAGAGVRGSLYAYIVGLMAGVIGWGILGAMEGILACILDALVVCWGSEVGSSGRGEVVYCREAGWLFSGDADPREGEVSLA